jgi:DNA processing protein
MQPSEAAIILSRFSGLSSWEIITTINYIFEGIKDEMREIKPEKVEIARNLLARYKEKDLRRDLDKKSISVLTIFDESYPQALLEIDDPPAVLYLKGNNELLNNPKMFSIVGSRKASGYGLDMSFQFAKALGEHGYVIVSGLALGIDGQAHRGALDAQAATIAVLGTPIDEAYPRANTGLYDKIIASGSLIISEYPSGYFTEKYHFVYRNRIVAALGEGLLVVEAGENSGALTSARYALNYGKDVYCLPADITKKGALGSNRLISSGAYCATSVNDFLSCIGVDSQAKDMKLTDDEEILLDKIRECEGNFDKMQIALEIDGQSLLVALMELEIRGLVKKNIFGDYEQA